MMKRNPLSVLLAASISFSSSAYYAAASQEKQEAEKAHQEQSQHQRVSQPHPQPQAISQPQQKNITPTQPVLQQQVQHAPQPHPQSQVIPQQQIQRVAQPHPQPQVIPQQQIQKVVQQQNIQQRVRAPSVRNEILRSPSMSHIDPQSNRQIIQRTARGPVVSPIQPQTMPAVSQQHPASAPVSIPAQQTVPSTQVDRSQSRKGWIRTPSMSRNDIEIRHPTIRDLTKQPPQIASTPHPTTTGPSVITGNQQHDATKVMPKRESGQNWQESRAQAKDFLQRHTQTRTPSKNVDQNFKDKLANRKNTDAQTSRNVQDRVKRDHPGHDGWFNDRFFANHHFHPHYHHSGDNWWRGVRWRGLSTWIVWGWSYPIYYDAQGISVVLPLDVETATGQVDQTSVSVVRGDWLPLGVFAAGIDADQAAYSNLFFQLAVNKEGEISGTYYNSLTDETYPLEGTVDQETQLAAWKLSDSPDSPIMTAGMYNLTQDVVDVQVYFQNGQEQSWVLVRVAP